MSKKYEIEEYVKKIESLNKRLNAALEDYATLRERTLKLEVENDNLKAALKSEKEDSAQTKSERDDFWTDAANYQSAYYRLDDLVTNLVNDMLRETIARKTHGERNQKIRMRCQEMLQIQEVAAGIASRSSSDDDVPF